MLNAPLNHLLSLIQLPRSAGSSLSLPVSCISNDLLPKPARFLSSTHCKQTYCAIVKIHSVYLSPVISGGWGRYLISLIIGFVLAMRAENKMNKHNDWSNTITAQHHEKEQRSIAYYAYCTMHKHNDWFKPPAVHPRSPRPARILRWVLHQAVSKYKYKNWYKYKYVINSK